MASSDDPVTPGAATAVDALREALSQADIVIPSLGVDDTWPHLDLVELGRIYSFTDSRNARIGCYLRRCVT